MTGTCHVTTFVLSHAIYFIFREVGRQQHAIQQAGKRDVGLHVLVHCIRCCRNCGRSNARLLTYLESDERFIRSFAMRCKTANG